MKKLFVLLGLVAAFAFAACDGDDGGEAECVGVACDEEFVLDLDDPIVDDEKPIEQEAQTPLPEVGSATPISVVPVDPQEHQFVQPQVGDIDDVTPDQLTPEELAKVDLLRGAIETGLVLGKDRYLETVSIALQNLDVIADYEGAVTDGFAELEQEVEECPFMKYYDNGFKPTGVACDYLVDMAKVEVYSELTKMLDGNPLPAEFDESGHFEEANFWYEQGAISGVEEQRTLVRTDLKQRDLCNKNPTPVESSYEKGVVLGRQLFAEKLNAWLAGKGHTPDYPVMSSPIQVCNADQSMLLPAKQVSLNAIPNKKIEVPLCKEDYVPPTQEGVLQYSQATIDYEKGLKKGIEAEFALAAVIVFKVIPCNVSDPIVIDLDGDGIELLPIQRGVNFDLYATGSQQAVAWVSPDDGLLVYDRDGNGSVDTGAELFGNLNGVSRDGFEHLAQLDDNMDGVIDARDGAFHSLAVWKDADSNGISSAGELAPLDALGISSISLNAVPSGLMSAGNRIPLLSTTGGVPHTIGDAFLSSAPYPRLTR